MARTIQNTVGPQQWILSCLSCRFVVKCFNYCWICWSVSEQRHSNWEYDRLPEHDGQHLPCYDRKPVCTNMLLVTLLFFLSAPNVPTCYLWPYCFFEYTEKLVILSSYWSSCYHLGSLAGDGLWGFFRIVRWFEWTGEFPVNNAAANAL